MHCVFCTFFCFYIILEIGYIFLHGHACSVAYAIQLESYSFFSPILIYVKKGGCLQLLMYVIAGLLLGFLQLIFVVKADEQFLQLSL